MKKKTAKQRHSLSKKRQALWVKIKTMEQRQVDAEHALGLGAPDAPEKLAFCIQEVEKLRKQLKLVDRGFTRQRAWANGQRY